METLVALALSFSISSGSAAQRLNEFSHQSGIQVLYLMEEFAPVTTNAVEGYLDPMEALDRMIAGTDTVYEVTETGTITFRRLRPEYPFYQDGWHYACVPMDWVAGFVYNRLGLLVLRMGLLPRDEMYCTPEAPISTGEEPSAAVPTQRAGTDSQRHPRSTHTPGSGRSTR